MNVPTSCISGAPKRIVCQQKQLKKGKKSESVNFKRL